MEVDPTKLDEAADPKVNTLELWLTAQKIFSCITRSVNSMPAELVYVPYHILSLSLPIFSKKHALISLKGGTPYRPSSSRRKVPRGRGTFLSLSSLRLTNLMPNSHTMQYKGMGGFLFLRFVCPALTAPHVFGLIDGNNTTHCNRVLMISLAEPPCPTAQRQYILISKVLQNLANNTLPGAKEEYMRTLNDFITTNLEEMKDFFEKILV